MLSLSEAAASGAPAQPSLDLPPDDKVVASLDVVVCSATDALGGRVVLLQQPLRGAWRPYDLPRAAAARMRPKARRMEFELPLQTAGPNYNKSYGDERPEGKPKRGGGSRSKVKAEDGGEEADGKPGGRKGDAAGPMERLLLRSQPVEEGGGDYAIGVVRGGRLLLVPVDYALQLRPHLAHLSIPSAEGKAGGGGGGGGGGKGRGGGAAGDSDHGGDEDEEGGGLVEIEVQVKRRETERQQAARLKSYSHLQAEEEAEEWRRLQVTEAGGARLWATIEPQRGAEAAAAPLAALSREDYLELVTPGAGGPGA
ncbi:hypothetical protein MNEG_0608, partial [Monoraphidium neglectum]